MAKPIKETPILKGKDAKKFVADHNASKDRVVLQKERERILHNYNLLKAAETKNKHIPA